MRGLQLSIELKILTPAVWSNASLSPGDIQWKRAPRACEAGLVALRVQVVLFVTAG